MKPDIQQNERHHIVIDGLPFCQISEPWARFFTCMYQWKVSAEQVANKVRNIQINKGRNILVLKGRCPHCGV